MNELRKNKSIQESGFLCLDSIGDTDISDILQRFKNNNRRCTLSREVEVLSKYPPALRSFAMTLHFYFPKAYCFVRKKFLSALPHARTIVSWYSSVNGEPGFIS